MAGTLIGGLVVAQISQRDDRWKLWAPAIMSGLAGPVFALCFLTNSFAAMVGALLFVVAARWIRGDIKRAALAKNGIPRPPAG